MKILTLLTLSLTVALGMPPGKENVPGPMVEDGPPAQVAVEDVAPMPEDQEDSQGMRDVEARARGGHRCRGFSHDGRCYRFFRRPKGAVDAEVFCQNLSRGGHLASITSQHLHRDVLRLVHRSNRGPTRVWVGGVRYLTTARFTWLDGSSWIYDDWLPGKPKRTSSHDNCVEVLANGKFNDKRCRKAQAFICSSPE